MKSPFDIELTTLHVGKVHKVVSLSLHGQDHAGDYLEALEQKSERTFDKLMGLLEFVADQDRYENKIKFRSLGKSVSKRRSTAPTPCDCMYSTIEKYWRMTH